MTKFLPVSELPSSFIRESCRVLTPEEEAVLQRRSAEIQLQLRLEFQRMRILDLSAMVCS